MISDDDIDATAIQEGIANSLGIIVTLDIVRDGIRHVLLRRDVTLAEINSTSDDPDGYVSGATVLGFIYGWIHGGHDIE